MLIMAQPLTELIYHRGTAIFLLQNIRFDLELKKPILKPSQKIEILGGIRDFSKTEFLLPQEKLGKIISQCKEVAKREVNILEFFQLIGKLGSTAQAVLPAHIQVSYLQRI